MKRDSVIKLKELLTELGSEVQYLNDTLKRDKIFLHQTEIDFIIKKSLKTYELATKLKYQK